MAPAVEGYARERPAATRGPRSDPVPDRRPDLTGGQRPESLPIEARAPEESKADLLMIFDVPTSIFGRFRNRPPYPFRARRPSHVWATTTSTRKAPLTTCW